MKKLLLLSLLSFLTLHLSAQQSEGISTEKVWRINILNPGVEFELPTGNYSTFSTGLGVGYGGSYPDLTYGSRGFIYIIAPFLDLQKK